MYLPCWSSQVNVEKVHSLQKIIIQRKLQSQKVHQNVQVQEYAMQFHSFSTQNNQCCYNSIHKYTVPKSENMVSIQHSNYNSLYTVVQQRQYYKTFTFQKYVQWTSDFYQIKHWVLQTITVYYCNLSAYATQPSNSSVQIKACNLHVGRPSHRVQVFQGRFGR